MTIVNCTICGKETDMDGTQLCDGYYELKSQSDRLLSENPKQAATFFWNMYKKALIKTKKKSK